MFETKKNTETNSVWVKTLNYKNNETKDIKIYIILPTQYNINKYLLMCYKSVGYDIVHLFVYYEWDFDGSIV